MSNQTTTDVQVIDGTIDILTAAGDFVTLADLRAEWATAGVSRDQVDRALTALHTAHRISLIPESNQKMLTDSQRAAALRLGGEDRHLAAIPEALTQPAVPDVPGIVASTLHDLGAYNRETSTGWYPIHRLRQAVQEDHPYLVDAEIDDALRALSGRGAVGLRHSVSRSSDRRIGLEYKGQHWGLTRLK